MTDDGTLVGWGAIPTFDEMNNYITTPSILTYFKNTKSVETTFYDLTVLDRGGTVWAWGDNSYGQLGNSNTSDSIAPTKVETLSNIKAIAISGSNSFALKDDGTVWGWGCNNFISGDKDKVNISVPMKIEGLSDITAIAGGEEVFLALKKDGTVYELGYYYTKDNYIRKTTPSKVSALSDIISISCGNGYYMA